MPKGCHGSDVNRDGTLRKANHGGDGLISVKDALILQRKELLSSAGDAEFAKDDADVMEILRLN